MDKELMEIGQSAYSAIVQMVHAVKIEDGVPTTAHLEVQDWFKPWTTYYVPTPGVLLEYVSRFYFGE